MCRGFSRRVSSVTVDRRDGDGDGDGDGALLDPFLSSSYSDLKYPSNSSFRSLSLFLPTLSAT